MDDKKIAKSPFAALCCLNSKYIHASLAPWCLLAGINTYAPQISACVAEGTINEAQEDVLNRLVKIGAKVYLFSCYIWNIQCTCWLAQKLKESCPDVKIVFGGPEVAYRAQNVLQNMPYVDYVSSGEGEYPTAVLLTALKNGRLVQGVPGLSFRTENEIIVAEPYVTDEIPPSPYTEQFLSELKGRIAYLESSRGCPFRCAFCLSGRCGGVRYYPLERTFREMLLLANSGSKIIKFVDRTFNANRSRAKAIMQFICKEYGNQIPRGVCFHFEVAGDLLDQETIEILKHAPAGSMQLEIGLQSFNEKTLEYVHRKTNTALLCRQISSVIALKTVHVHIDLIAGLPYEDFASFKTSFNLAYAMQANMLQLGFLKLLYGADMREDINRYPCKYNSAPPYEVICTPWISKQELNRLHCLEDALERTVNSGRFLRTVDYMLQQSKMTPFDLLLSLGEYAADKGVKNISLEDYVDLLLQYGTNVVGCNGMLLRDTLVCDYLSFNRSGRLPSCLKGEYAPQLKAALIFLAQSKDAAPQKGIKRSAALIDGGDTLVYVDYINPDPIDGHYQLHKVPLK